MNLLGKVTCLLDNKLKLYKRVTDANGLFCGQQAGSPSRLLQTTPMGAATTSTQLFFYVTPNRMVENDNTDTTYLGNNAQVLSDLKALDTRFEGATVTATAAYEGPIVLSTIRAKTYSEMSGVIEMTA